MRTAPPLLLTAFLFLFPLACCGTESVAPVVPAAVAVANAASETAPPTTPAPTAAETTMPNYNPLTKFEADVILKKGTERAGAGEYTDSNDEGTYVCRQCNTPLYRSADKFHSGCGWPSFDDEIAGAVERHDDSTHGMVRTEIVCANCKGHLGHVFTGEMMTKKDSRHCVNSVSMRFVAAGKELPKPIVKSGK